MSRRSLAIALSMLATTAQAAEPQQFEMPPDQVVARITHVALTPCRESTDTRLPAGLAARYEALLLGELRALGLRATPPEEYVRLWRELSIALGGVFDPSTGKPIAERYRAAREHTLRELQSLHGIDGVADCAVFVEGNAAVESDEYTSYSLRIPPWRLGDEVLMWKGKKLRGFYDQMPQRVRVLSVGVSLSDLNDVTLYRDATRLGWFALRVAGEETSRPIKEIASPDKDERVRGLLRALRDAYAARAATPSAAPRGAP